MNETESMIKKSTKVISKKGLNYVIGTDGKTVRDQKKALWDAA